MAFSALYGGVQLHADSGSCVKSLYLQQLITITNSIVKIRWQSPVTNVHLGDSNLSLLLLHINKFRNWTSDMHHYALYTAKQLPEMIMPKPTPFG